MTSTRSRTFPWGTLISRKNFLILKGHDMNAADLLARVPDACPLKTELGPLQRVIKNEDLLGACLDAGLGHGGHNRGVGGAPPVRSIGKGHVRFEDDALSLLNEAGNSAQRLKGFSRGGPGSPETTTRSYSSFASKKEGLALRPKATPAAVVFKN